MKTILVTGAAGFIGARTARLLMDQGCHVVGIDNMNDYYDPRLKEYRLTLLREERAFTFIQGDVEDRPLLMDLFGKNGFEAVFNLAARAGVRYSIENPHVYMSTNAQGTLNLLEAMRIHSVKKLVIASTSSLYAGQELPFVEDLPVNTPISPYAASKKSAEVMAYTYHHLYGIDVSVVRYFTVYGPGGRPDMSVFRFIKWIDDGVPVELFGDGSQSRDFTYIDDIAEGTVLAMKELGYEIINLGGGKNPKSISYLIELIETMLGKKARIDYKPFHKADMMETWADIRKADRLLGWKPHVDVEQGIERTVSWFKDNRSWLKEIEL